MYAYACFHSSAVKTVVWGFTSYWRTGENNRVEECSAHLIELGVEDSKAHLHLR